MKNKVLNCLIVSAVSATVAFASPALGRGGGGMGGGMHGGMGGGMGGGMHGGMTGGMHGGGMHFGGSHFAGAPFAHAAVSPRFAHAAFSPRFSHLGFRDRRFHHRFRNFAFFGGPFVYAAYDCCLGRAAPPVGFRTFGPFLAVLVTPVEILGCGECSA